MQTEQIRLGYENGLTDEQVRLYVNPEFDYRKMEQIRLGYEHGLTDEQVKFYEKFKVNLMRTVRVAYECGFSDDCIKLDTST